MANQDRNMTAKVSLGMATREVLTSLSAERGEVMADGVTVEWEGLDAWVAHVTNLVQRVPEQSKEIMSGIGSDAIEVMDSHTPVWKGKPDRSHRPGELKEGNTLTETEDGFELSNAVKHAPFVEYGTRKMAAEPFLQPAVEFARQEMADRLPKALEG